MGDHRRILTGPLRLTGPLSSTQRSLLVSVDALCRRAAAEGRAADCSVGILTGSLASQAALERELAREGHDRETLGRDAFVARMREHEAAAREEAIADAAVLGVELDLGAAAAEVEAAEEAARVAFVLLYEAGLLELADRVVGTCPRCEAVVEGIDAEDSAVQTERLTLRVPLGADESIEVCVDAPELLLGAVALAVPTGDSRSGASAEVPLAENVIPVVDDPDVDAPRFLVPGHSEDDLAIARRHGLLPVLVIDDEGAVQLLGPLHGQSRFAARSTAAERLREGDHVVSSEQVEEPGRRCRRCGTLVIDRLGRHWFLRTAELEVAAADAVRQGELDFAPSDARDEFLERAGQGESWCLSSRVLAGVPVPVATCLDCGRVAVEVDLGSSCNKCMGALEPDDGALDARFVGVVWALATLGWPDDERAYAAQATDALFLTTRAGLHSWVLPMTSLGLRLGGAIPFSRVAVLVTSDDAPQDRLVGSAARLDALTSTRADEAIALAEALAEPPLGEGDVDEVLPLYESFFEAGLPGAALDVLATLVAGGVPASSADRVRALAAPLLGD